MVTQTEGKRRVGDGTPGPGRPKGLPNKVTAEAKQMILEALSKAGGVDYLVAKAESHPAAFMSLVGKVLPLQVQGDPNAPLSLTVTFHKPGKDG